MALNNNEQNLYLSLYRGFKKEQTLTNSIDRTETKTISTIFNEQNLFLSSHVGTCSGFSIREATIQDLQTALKNKQLTSEKLVELYLAEIRRLNPVLKGIVEENPDAVLQAKKADAERQWAEKLGLLSRILILLKDNIATKDKLNTTAGYLVLRDAGVVKKLRRAGALLLGKAGLSEWAHFRSSGSPC